VDLGSRQENASQQKTGARFRSNQNRKGSRLQALGGAAGFA
jgi:hypothetical protein